MTERAFIRPDRTLYHAVEYDTRTGSRRRGYTFQGYSDESSWSRGAGWAVYGYAATAAATGERRYLDIAVGLAEKWLEQLSGRACPPWDFTDPGDAPAWILRPPRSWPPRFSTSEPCIPIAHRADDGQARAYVFWRVWPGSYLARDPAHRGLLLHGCYSKPHNIGVDAAVVFGDYYFVEAISRLRFPGKFVNSFSALPA